MNTLVYWLLFLVKTLPFVNLTDNQSGNVFRRIDYNLASPDRVYILPPVLFEISGITEVDASTIACVQDENGIVFFYDLNKNQTNRHIVFASAGDYEDLARVDNTLYILRSDEVLAGISNFKSANFKREAYPAGIPGRNAEGLCYDKNNNRLLIAAKEISDDNSDNKDKRFIYGFDTGSKKLIEDPVISIDLQEVNRFAIKNNIKVPMKSKKKGGKEEPDIKLQISAFGINPVTDRLFIISGRERLFFVFDKLGNIEYIEKLNPDLFPQPEGITFMRNGDMLISNEGRNELATILRFNYRPVSKKSGSH
jgi:hypothetical protein